MNEPATLCLCSVCGVLFRTSDGYYNTPVGKQCVSCGDGARPNPARRPEDK